MAFHGFLGDACITAPAEKRIDLSDILEAPASEYVVRGGCTIYVQLVFVQSDALDSGGELGALNLGLRYLSFSRCLSSPRLHRMASLMDSAKPRLLFTMAAVAHSDCQSSAS